MESIFTRKKLLIIAAAVALILVIVLIILLTANTPSKAAVQYLQKLNAGSGMAYRVVSQEIDGNMAEVGVNLIIVEGFEKGPITVICHKIDGKWEAVRWY